MTAMQHTTRARFRRATRRAGTRGVRAVGPAGTAGTAAATAADVAEDEALFLCPDREAGGFVPSRR